MKNGASSHETNYTTTFFFEILNLEGHINRCVCSQVTAILLNGWIVPTGEVALGRVCPSACAAGWFKKDPPLKWDYSPVSPVELALTYQLFCLSPLFPTDV